MAPRQFLTGIDVKNQRIQNVASASSGTDAPNWAQVQSLVAGLDWKASVRAASTANVTVATPGTTIDGVTLTTNDRVLLKNQTTGSENGIYVFNGSASALTRASDFTTGTASANATVYVSEGTVNADTAWTLSTNDTITIGTTALTWVQFGAGIAYSAGTGLTLVSTTFAIDTAVVVRKYATNVGDGSSTAITVTHNLGTLDVQVQLYEISTGSTVETDIVRATTNTLTLTFATAPTVSQYRCLVQG